MAWIDSKEDKEKVLALKMAEAEGNAELRRQLWIDLCVKYRKRLYNYSKKWISKIPLRNYFDPDEAVNEALIKFPRIIHNYDGLKPFDQWLIGVTTNCIRQMHRDFYKVKGYGRKETEENPDSENINMNELLEARADISRLHDFFTSIDKGYCFDILVLYHHHEMADREIAIFLNELKASEKRKKNIDAASERIRNRRHQCKKVADEFEY